MIVYKSCRVRQVWKALGLMKTAKIRIKKLLTKSKQHDILDKLFRENKTPKQKNKKLLDKLKKI